MDFVYPTAEEAIVYHRVFLGLSEHELVAIDREKLEAAMNRACMHGLYGGADIVKQAVMIAVGISQAQAFEDGNNRVGFGMMVHFLRLNGYAFVGRDMIFAP